MSVPKFEYRIRMEDSQSERDRFDSQAAVLRAILLALSGLSYAILMQVLLEGVCLIPSL